MIFVLTSQESGGSNAGAQIKAVAPNHWSTHYSLSLPHTIKSAIFTYECPGEAVISIVFTKSRPFSTCLVSILCDEMESMHKVLI